MSEILDNDLLNDKTYELASKGTRFANYLIDLIGYLILAMIIGIIVGLFTVSSGNEEFLLQEPTLESQLIDYLVSFIIMTTYYTAFEAGTNGKTLGKYITKTRAVNLDYTPINFSTALKRSLCRLIPFEAFSFFGEDGKGWHDSFPKTIVIKDNDWHPDSEFFV